MLRNVPVNSSTQRQQEKQTAELLKINKINNHLFKYIPEVASYTALYPHPIKQHKPVPRQQPALYVWPDIWTGVPVTCRY